MRRCARRSWVFKKKVFEYKGREIRQGADLSGADLSGLAGSAVLAALGSLTGLNFANANLTFANFDGLELQKVNFEGANLTGASFANCWFPQRSGSDPLGFSGATLTGATITAARYADPTTGTFTIPEWYSLGNNTTFTRANLDLATLGGNFSNFEFANASLRGARFSRGALFSLCDFTGADMSGSHFEGDRDFEFPVFGEEPPGFGNIKLQGAKLLDLTGCAYFAASPLPEITVADGIFYLEHAHVGNALNHYKIFRHEPNPQYPDFVPLRYVALTPQGFVRESSAEVGSSSGVESKLAEVRQLLDDGLINQAEHDVLRRKILGI